MKVRILSPVAFGLSLLFLSSVVSGETELVDHVSSQIQELKQEVGFSRGKSAYSSGQAGESILKTRNFQLENALVKFARFLNSNREGYNALLHREWVLVNRALLDVDSWISSEVAWGNLVLKVFLLDFISESIFSRLPDLAAAEESSYYKSLARDLLFRSPSRLATLSVALEHIGESVVENLDGLDYGRSQTVSAILEVEAKYNKYRMEHLIPSTGLHDEVVKLYRAELERNGVGFEGVLRGESVHRMAIDFVHLSMAWQVFLYSCMKDYMIAEGLDEQALGVSFDDFYQSCFPKIEGGDQFSHFWIENSQSYKKEFLRSSGKQDLHLFFSGDVKFWPYIQFR